MPNPLSLARVWRILKEVDLDAIRRAADTPVRVLVLADTIADADDLATLVAGNDPAAVEWITAMDAALASEYARRGGAANGHAILEGPDVVLVMTRGPRLTPALTEARRPWLERKARVVTIAVGSGERHGKLRSQGHLARLTLDALSPWSIEEVSKAILAVAEPDHRVALARQFATLRPCTFDQLISETARINGGYAFSAGLAETIPLLDIPLNIGDMVVLTKNQLVMSYRLALAAGKQGQPRQLIGEIVGVLGGGLVFRQLARQLVGLIPVFGLLPKVAVAYGGTWAIGRAVVMWTEQGEALSREHLKQLLDEGLARGRRLAASLRPRREPSSPDGQASTPSSS